MTTPILRISSTHAGSFVVGQSGATYTLTVTNDPAAATTVGAVTVTDTVPSGLALVSMAGDGWSCGSGTCTRNDSLSAASSYPVITVTVSVASNAPSSVSNQASVSGGGSADFSASDPTTIVTNPPVLSVKCAHSGNLTLGQNGAVYTVTVNDKAGSGPTNGAVTVSDTIPAGLTLTSMSGTGWSCTGSTCTRNDVLSAGSSYPAIVVTVNVAADAPSSVTNQVSVTGGSSAAGSATDTTYILAPGTALGYTIATVAGTGTAGNSGDGGAATSAQLYWPYGVTLDTVGNLYIADQATNRIRKVAANGVITTVAGMAAQGFYGDGGPATSAHLYWPYGVTLDAAGNLYIADSGNHRVRKVGTDGVITTVAGNGTMGYAGDGGPATSAYLFSPSAVVVDAAGNLYIADPSGATIRKVAPNGVISTVAGSTSGGYGGDGGAATGAQLNRPSGIAVDAMGALYIADTDNNRIRKVTANGVITTVAGNGTAGYSGDGGAATRAALNQPYDVAVDAAGALYIADSSNRLIRKVALDGTISTVAGNGGSGTADTGSALGIPLGSLGHLMLDGSGSIYVADWGGSRVRKLQPAIVTLPQVSIASTHSGSFMQGQSNATYTVTVSNGAGVGAALGLTSVTETLPAGLTLVSMSGTGWTCTGSSCTRSDALSAGTSYPAITIKVNVASNAAASVTNQVNVVTDGGLASAIATDPTTVTPIPMLSIASTHTGSFTRGQTGTTYTLTVSNGATAGPTLGVVTVSEAVPTGLTLVSMSGTGWSCSGTTCTRSDVLSPGASYPAITATVNVASNAASSVTNYVTVSGGGSTTASSTDMTVTGVPALSILSTHGGSFTQGQTGAAYTVTVSNAAGATTTFGTVTVSETVPVGLALVSMTGSGWSCAATTCTRSDVLSPGASYPAITVIVNVATNAPSSVTNQVSVSGGASASGNAGDATNIILVPALWITSTHLGTFTLGQNAAVYTVTVSDRAGSGPTSGVVTVSDTIPAGLTLVSMSGTGWSCTGSTCTRNDVLSGGSSYPAIVVTVNVATDASSSVTNQVSVTGGSSVAGSATDTTYILAPGTALGYTIATVAGTGTAGSSGDGGVATSTQLYWPYGMTLDAAGNLYVADKATNRIRKVAANGIISTVVGTGSQGSSGDGGPATSALLYSPTGVTLDAAGNLYIADSGNHRVRKVGTNGVITAVAGNGTVGYAGDGGPATSAYLFSPSAVVLDAAGNLYIADPSGATIRKVAPNGVISTVAGSTSGGYGGDGGTATSAKLNNPSGIAVDAMGALYIADTGNNRIRKVAANGVITTVAGNGTAGYSGDGGVATSAALNQPYDVAVDATGALYIADSSNRLTRKVALDGSITTVAGNGGSGTADTGSALGISLGSLGHLMLDGAGSIYVADWGGSRVRKLQPAIVTLPQVSIASTHTGSFMQGQSNATYTVTVSNGAGVGATLGLTSVTEALPTGLTLVSMSGTGWTCTGSSCTRSDALSAGASYPAITVKVNVASNAAASVTNQVSVVTDGGLASAIATDPTTVTPIPMLSIASTHTGSFTRGQTGATYTLTVSNGATAGPTLGEVTVWEAVPTGLTLVSMSGTGWSCTGTICTRSDVLSPGASYPTIRATVNVASNAASSLTNNVVASGGGSTSASSTDVTTVQ